MLKVGVIGHGAIAQYVSQALPGINAQLVLVIARAGRFDAARAALGSNLKVVERIGIERPDVVVDCAGHSGLQQHGVEILNAGVPLITVSIGALADQALQDKLIDAAKSGRTNLRLSTGAIGALDAIASARYGALETVTYIGRKPPRGWKGSHAEQVVNLDDMGDCSVTHFEGSARDAALLYPKNANVAAAVALAGLGFDNTRVRLIADPTVNVNIHEIHATGDFGEMQFSILGKTLPDNTRTSALAAMSVVKMLSDQSACITF
jgi:aspartate dehydrogenase